MIFKEDLGTGYMYSYSPYSPHANGAGKVMEHVYVMERHLGRLLIGDECVHHIDRNRKNNNISNLQLMTNSEHSKLHALEDGLKGEDKVCHTCGTIYSGSNEKYCGSSCYDPYSGRKFDPSISELTEMVWKEPMSKLAKYYSVSDVAIKKRCKLLGIETPPRGYFIRKKVNRRIAQ